MLVLCRDNNFPFFNEDDENFDRKLSRTMRSFDEAYFADKNLIFILLNEDGFYLPKIDTVAIESGILTVYFSNPTINEADATAEKNLFVYIVEIEKAIFKDVNGITVKKADKGMANEYDGINVYSDFYSLEYAFNRGLITQNDIRSIGYYQNCGKEWRGEDDAADLKNFKDFVETDYQPLTKAPEELSKETIEKIKISYVDMLNSSLKYLYEQKGMSIKKDLITGKDIDEVKYFGTYNGYIAVAVSSKMSLQQVTTPTIADTVFYYSNSSEIVFLFRDGK